MAIPSTSLFQILKAMRQGIGAINFEQKPSKKVYPEYYKQIAKPMGLIDIEKNLKKKRYETVAEYYRDLDLIWQNCKLYNQDESVLHTYSLELQKLMKSKFEEYEIDVESPDFEMLEIQYPESNKAKRKPANKKATQVKPPPPRSEIEEEKKILASDSDQESTLYYIKQSLRVKKEEDYEKREISPPKTQREMRLLEREKALREKQEEEKEPKKRLKGQKRVQGEGPRALGKVEGSGSRSQPKATPSVLCKLNFMKTLHSTNTEKVREVIEYGLKMYPKIVTLSPDQTNFEVYLNNINAKFLEDVNQKFSLGMNLSIYI